MRVFPMVLKYTPNGIAYHEPPYTEAEEADFYRRVGGGPVSVVRPATVVAPKEKPPQKPKE
jgi:hypothetical protein